MVTLPTASMMRAYVEQYVYPKLHPHQSVILLVPAFGSRCAAVAKANQEPLPPSVCPTLACNDERAAAIITGYFKWAQEDTRVAAIAPTFYAGCGRNDTVSQSSHVSCFPAVCEKQPVLFWDWLDVGFGDMNAMPTTLKGWQAVGSAIVSGSPKTLKTDDTSTRALPPPVVNATCAAELNAYCDGGCGGRSTCSPPSWKPMYVTLLIHYHFDVLVFMNNCTTATRVNFKTDTASGLRSVGHLSVRVRITKRVGLLRFRSERSICPPVCVARCCWVAVSCIF